MLPNNDEKYAQYDKPYTQAKLEKIFSPVDIQVVSTEFLRVSKQFEQLINSVPTPPEPGTDLPVMLCIAIESLLIYNEAIQELHQFLTTHVPHMIGYLTVLQEAGRMTQEAVESTFSEEDKQIIKEMSDKTVKFISDKTDRLGE